MSKLSRIERETVINYNQAEDMAVMTTADTVVIRRMQKLADKSDKIFVEQENEHDWKFTFPKKWLKVQLPRQMTVEQRQAASERANVYLKGRS